MWNTLKVIWPSNTPRNQLAKLNMKPPLETSICRPRLNPHFIAQQQATLYAPVQKHLLLIGLDKIVVIWTIQINNIYHGPIRINKVGQEKEVQNICLRETSKMPAHHLFVHRALCVLFINRTLQPTLTSINKMINTIGDGSSVPTECELW